MKSGTGLEVDLRTPFICGAKVGDDGQDLMFPSSSRGKFVFLALVFFKESFRTPSGSLATRSRFLRLLGAFSFKYPRAVGR